MALGRYTGVARSANGDLIRAGEVTVFAAGSSTLAVLWRDDAGTIPADNPVITDYASGAWSAVMEAGLYDFAYPDGSVVHNVPVDVSGDAPPAWDDITGKPATFPPTLAGTGSAATGAHSDHTHTASQITDAGVFGRTMLATDSNGAAQLELGITALGSSIIEAVDGPTVRTAIGAGTSSLVLGTAAGTALVGNDPRLTAQPVGTASVRALVGGTATTASASDHTHTGLLTGSATAVNTAATFADLTAATTAYNALLTALRARGIITGT